MGRLRLTSSASMCLFFWFKNFDGLANSYMNYLDSEPDLNYEDMEKLLIDALEVSKLAENPYHKIFITKSLFDLYQEQLEYEKTISTLKEGLDFFDGNEKNEFLFLFFIGSIFDVINYSDSKVCKTLNENILDIHQRGYVNIDSTVILQKPKLSPHIITIKKNLSTLMRINENQVSVKATTTDFLGYVGTSKGWSALAISTLTKKL